MDWLVGALSLGFVANLLAYALSTIPLDIGTSRYLLAALVYGGIVAAKAFTDLFFHVGWTKRVWLAAVLMLLAASSVWSFGNWFRSPLPSSLTASWSGLVDWLVGHDLRYGYASYADASVITVASEGRVAVRPVTSTHQHANLTPAERQTLRLLPFLAYNSAEQWYREPATFVVFHNPWGNVTLEAARRTFGPWAYVQQVGPFQVAVWTKDLSKNLSSFQRSP